ncbi:hypothetical protein TN53_43085, partial [Streptomyces sp. WM6386]
PLIATALLQSYGTATPISVYVTLAAVLTAIALLAATETRGRDLADVTAGPGAAQPVAGEAAPTSR